MDKWPQGSFSVPMAVTGAIRIPVCATGYIHCSRQLGRSCAFAKWVTLFDAWGTAVPSRRTEVNPLIKHQSIGKQICSCWEFLHAASYVRMWEGQGGLIRVPSPAPLPRFPRWQTSGRTPCHLFIPQPQAGGTSNSLPLSYRATPLTWNISFMLSLVLISMHLAHPTEPHSALSPVT